MILTRNALDKANEEQILVVRGGMVDLAVDRRWRGRAHRPYDRLSRLTRIFRPNPSQFFDRSFQVPGRPVSSPQTALTDTMGRSPARGDPSVQPGPGEDVRRMVERFPVHPSYLNILQNEGSIRA